MTAESDRRAEAITRQAMRCSISLLVYLFFDLV